MLEGLKALLASEKALVGGALVIAATVLVIWGSMSVDDWQTYTRDVFITYVAGKTVQGSVALVAKRETKTKTEAEVTIKNGDTHAV